MIEHHSFEYHVSIAGVSLLDSIFTWCCTAVIIVTCGESFLSIFYSHCDRHSQSIHFAALGTRYIIIVHLYTHVCT